LKLLKVRAQITLTNQYMYTVTKDYCHEPIYVHSTKDYCHEPIYVQCTKDYCHEPIYVHCTKDYCHEPIYVHCTLVTVYIDWFVKVICALTFNNFNH
jgi:hypothetical protein